jgi:Tol biopolymer transport system component
MVKQQLTSETGGILGYDINREGTAVYYSTVGENGGSAIYRFNLGGSDLNSDSQGENIVLVGSPDLILECPQASCRAPRISPDGDLLAYERTASAGSGGAEFPQVWIINLGAGSSKSPQLAGDADHQTLLPNWSPDSLLAFYDKDQSAFIFFDPATGKTITFPNQTGEGGSWHPGGNYYTAPEITFVSGVSDGESGLETLAVSQLIRFDMTDKTSLNLSPDGYVEDTYPAYSPDGTALAFSRKFLDDSSWTPGRQIWILPDGNSQAVQYTFNPNIHYYYFSWSPDGRRLVYARVDQTRLTEPPEIWMLDPQTGTSEELVKGGFSPRWIP